MSAVLDIYVTDVLGVDGNNIDYTCLLNQEMGYRDVSINIYELAYKCKEWAKYNKLFGNGGYDLYTEHLKGINYPSAMNETLLNKNYDYWRCFYQRCNPSDSTIGQGITEPEAIFKACQWILEQMKEQK